MIIIISAQQRIITPMKIFKILLKLCANEMAVEIIHA